MRFTFKIFLLFGILSLASLILIKLGNVHFGTVSYWQNHGIFFLIFLTIFPRLTLLFSSVPFGGLFWWLGWFFAPRLLVAVLATIAYWNTNPLLVIIAWLFALGGESGEKYYIHRMVYYRAY